MKNAFFLWVALPLLFVGLSCARADDSAPDAMVKSTANDVLTLVKQSKDKNQLRGLAEQKVLPHFDFNHMTRLAVGTAWRQATPTQQQALEDAFRTLLVNTYTNALSIAVKGNEAIDVKPLQVQAQQTDVTVRSVVNEPGKQAVNIDYRVENTANGWKVYDVVVENLSLVTSYRGSFSSEINKSGIDGLIKSLQAKNSALAKS